MPALSVLLLLLLLPGPVGVASPTKGFPRQRVDAAPLPDAAYVRDHATLLLNRNFEIFTVRGDGTGRTPLRDDGFTPSWTPDGRIIFSSPRGGSVQIWIMDADGGNLRQIGNVTAGEPVMPQMAENGTIVFMLTDDHSDENAGIWVMREDGSGMRELARGTQPSLARSGTWLSYTYETEDPYHRQIWRINTDGSDKRQLTFLGDPDYPDANASNISPDEKWIAIFSGKEADKGEAGLTQDPATWGHRNVAIIPAEGGARRRLTPCKPLQEASPSDCIAADNPAWTPDGTWLVFDTDKDGVWMIDLAGRNMQRVYETGRGPVRVPVRYPEEFPRPRDAAQVDADRVAALRVLDGVRGDSMSGHRSGDGSGELSSRSRSPSRRPHAGPHSVLSFDASASGPMRVSGVKLMASTRRNP